MSDLLQATELVLCQRFGGEDVESTAVLVAYESVQGGKLIAEALSTGTGRGDYDVFPGKDGVQGLCLVAIES